MPSASAGGNMSGAMGRAPRKAPPRNELAIQTLFRSRVNARAPQIKVVAIPNAGKRGQKAMNQAMREGMAIGFPDVMCLAPGKIAFIEFKDPCGELTNRQESWMDGLNAMGFPATVSRDPDHALRFLQEHGFPFVFEMGPFGP